MNHRIDLNCKSECCGTSNIWVYGRFPDGFFPGKTFPGKTIPGWSLSRKVVSRVVIFPDDYETFPGMTS